MAEYMYEGMFLVDSNKFAASQEGVTASVMGLLERINATVVASRPWKEDKLCYPIKGQRKGLYFLTCFRADGGQIPELDRLCSLSDVVLRHMVIRHPKVVFDAMVEAMTQHDGAIHSPEQKGGDMPMDGGRDERRGRGDRMHDDSYSR